MKLEDFFSGDYESARGRFREAATRAGAALHSIALSSKGPAGEALCIDVGWIGSPRPRRVLLHTSGLHGVEAYTGSAVQLALLDRGPSPNDGDALILVHVLNPFGMSWLRRTNENNVDLNRNFIFDGKGWTGAPELYRVLDPLLNPPSPPARDGFAVRAAAIAMRYGFHRVKQAVAEGQYEYPRGLFFGGKELQPEAHLYTEWVRRHVAGAECVFALDLHTGLGRRGTDTAIPDMRINTTPPALLGERLGRKLVDVSGPSVAYEVRGSMGGALPHVLERTRIDFVLQEIGTEPPVKVFHALREENRWHFFGGGSIVHPAKQRLREALCPASVDWRRRAITLGVELAQAAARCVFERRT